MRHGAIASNVRRRCVFVTVFWGDWHRHAFVDANLPTMLAPGNLPALAADVECEYLVYTTPEDARQLTRNAAFQRLRSLVPVALKEFRPAKNKNFFNLQHEVWRRGIEHARRRGAFILLMPPDVAWADGSFATLRDALLAGKRALFMTFPRVVSETIIPALAERYPRDAEQALVVAPKDMMELALKHIHPLMAAYDRRAQHFPFHPEMVMWPVENDGFLLRLLARELFCFEPGHYRLNARSLLADSPANDEIQVFQDSREFLGISFTPLWKDMEWYLAPRRLDPLAVGRWWIDYDSPVNDRLSSVDLRFTCGAVDEAQWRQAKLQADALLAHLRSAREFTRVLLTLDRMGLARAASFLAAALRVLGLARRFPHRGPFVVLAPTDDAFMRAGFDRVPGDGMGSSELRRMIAAHVAVVASSRPLTSGSPLVTLAGETFQLGDVTRAEPCGDNLVLPVEAVLYRAAGNARANTAGAGAAQTSSGLSAISALSDAI